MPPVNYKNFLEEINRALDKRDDVGRGTYVTIPYKTPAGKKQYDLIKIVSKNIVPTDSILLIRAGIHGNETAGPLTLMHSIETIFDYAHSRGVKLIIYPLDNPSGFETNTRYNIENDAGDAGNNDFVRYELKNGKIVGDLGPINKFKKMALVF